MPFLNRSSGGATLAAMALFLSVVAAGCGRNNGPETVEVRGTIRLDGVPVPSGQIIFSDPAGVRGASAGMIENGEFSFPSTLGQRQVSITSPQKVEGAQARVGGIAGDPISETNPADVFTETIPPKYNTATELTVDVRSDGPSEFTFDLTSE